MDKKSKKNKSKHLKENNQFSSYEYENENFFNDDYEYENIVKDALKNGLGYSNPY